MLRGRDTARTTTAPADSARPGAAPARPPPGRGAAQTARRCVLAAGRLDQAVLLALRTRGHRPAVERVAQGLGTFGEFGLGWAALGLAGAALTPLAAGAGSWPPPAPRPRPSASTTLVKVAVGRKRPLIEGHPPLGPAPNKLSFPSAHSTTALAAATALGRVAPGARLPLYALAAADLRRPALPRHALPSATSWPAPRSVTRSAGPTRFHPSRPRQRPPTIAAADRGDTVKVGIVGHAQRGQVHALQRADPGGRRGRRTTRSRRSSPTWRSRPVPDERLDEIAATVGVDAGRPRIARGPRHRRPGPRRVAPARASATSSSPRSARPTRSATSSAPTPIGGVPHPDGRVDPVADAEMVEAELMLADLETASRRLERVGKQAKTLDKDAIAERDWLGRRRRRARAGRAGALGAVPDAVGPDRAAAAPGAHLQARPLRRQRRRGRGPAARPSSSNTPRGAAIRRSRSAPRSRPSWSSSTTRRPRSCAPSSASRNQASAAWSAPPTRCSS